MNVTMSFDCPLLERHPSRTWLCGMRETAAACRTLVETYALRPGGLLQVVAGTGNAAAFPALWRGCLVGREGAVRIQGGSEVVLGEAMRSGAMMILEGPSAIADSFHSFCACSRDQRRL